MIILRFCKRLEWLHYDKYNIHQHSIGLGLVDLLQLMDQSSRLSSINSKAKLIHLLGTEKYYFSIKKLLKTYERCGYRNNACDQNQCTELHFQGQISRFFWVRWYGKKLLKLETKKDYCSQLNLFIISDEYDWALVLRTNSRRIKYKMISISTHAVDNPRMIRVRWRIWIKVCRFRK